MVVGSSIEFRSASLNFIDLNQPQNNARRFELPVYEYSIFDRITFSPSDKYLAVSIDDQAFGDGVSHGYQVFLWDTQQFDGRKTGDNIKPLTIYGVQFPLFSPDSQFLLCAEPNQYPQIITPPKFHLWDVMKKVELSAFAGDGIAAFSPDSSLLAIHNESYTQILSTAALAAGRVEPITTIPDNEGQIKTLAFSANGKLLYLVEDSRVRVLGVP